MNTHAREDGHRQLPRAHTALPMPPVHGDEPAEPIKQDHRAGAQPGMADGGAGEGDAPTHTMRRLTGQWGAWLVQPPARGTPPPHLGVAASLPVPSPVYLSGPAAPAHPHAPKVPLSCSRALGYGSTGQMAPTWLCMNLRLIPSKVTCRRPPSPVFMSCTGNSPPSSGPAVRERPSVV